MDSGYHSGEYMYERIRELISLKKIKYQKLVSGNSFNIDNIVFSVFNPPVSHLKSLKEKNQNIQNNSLVIRMKYKQKCILFCSDIENQGAKFITDFHKDSLGSDIINLPDLNRNKAGMDALLKFSRPSHALINKRFTYFENKDKEWIKKALSKRNIKYYFTKDDGAIKVIINNNDFEIITSFNH